RAAGALNKRMHREEMMKSHPSACVAACAAAAFALASSSAATKAAELIVLTSMGPATGVYELAAGFEKASNNKVTVTFETATPLNQKLESNAPADLITGGPEQIADLIKKGKVVGANTPFGVAGLGLSVKVGAPRPDISTVEAYKAALI